MAASVDEEGGGKDGRDILAACGLQDKLINVSQIERASAGLGRQLLLTALSTRKDQRKLALDTLGPESQPCGPLLTLREWLLPEARQLIWLQGHFPRPVKQRLGIGWTGSNTPLPISGASGVIQVTATNTYRTFPGPSY